MIASILLDRTHFFSPIRVRGERYKIKMIAQALFQQFFVGN